MADFLTALLGGPAEQKSGGTWADRAWEILLGGVMSKSGSAINVKSALRVSVALSCCRVLAEGIAQIPLKLMQENGDNKLVAKDHPLHRVLSRRPNDWMTSFEFRETMMYHALLLKGGFAVKNRVRGQIVELLPVMPDRVRIDQNPDTTVMYYVKMQDGTEAPFSRDQMFHLRGPSWDGVQGMEIIDLAREALGLAIATEETHAKFHKNGAKTAGIISMEGELKEEGRKRLKTAFQDAIGGDNAFKTLVLDQGAKFHQMSMTGVDSQHIETRRLQTEEICRCFRVFPQMAGYADKTSTFASAEQFFIAHVVHSLGPWVERFEQVIDRDLLSEQEILDGFYSKFSVQALLRGDSAGRGTYFNTMYNIGAMNPNEIRALEDMNPYVGGEKYRVPLNMADPNAVPATPKK